MGLESESVSLPGVHARFRIVEGWRDHHEICFLYERSIIKTAGRRII